MRTVFLLGRGTTKLGILIGTSVLLRLARMPGTRLQRLPVNQTWACGTFILHVIRSAATSGNFLYNTLASR
jgi:hypothetical protein